MESGRRALVTLYSWRNVWLSLAVIALLVPARDALALNLNPITNGGFETLDAQGKPVDWELLGSTVTVTTDARSGQYALRLERGSGRNVPPEVGLNREWRADSRQQGKMLSQRKGGIVFWYKLISAAPNASVSVQVIPMSDRPFEDTGSPRAAYHIPLSHAGDGKWHQGKFVYDFTDNPKVKWVHVGARLTGGAAVLLLDDIEYVEQVGAVLQIERMHFYPDRDTPGRAGMFTCTVVNVGDAPSQPVRISLSAPQDWAVEPLLRTPPVSLPRDGAITYRWRIRGALTPAKLSLYASDGVVEVEEVFVLAPRLQLESVLVQPALVAPGEVAVVTATVHNRGHVVAEGVEMQCILPPNVPITLISGSRQRVGAILPTRKQALRWKVRASSRLGEWQVECVLSNTQESPQRARGTLIVTDALKRPAQQVTGAFWIRRGTDRIIGELRAGGHLVARMPHLGSVVVRLPNGAMQRLFPQYGAPIRKDPLASWMFSGAARDRAGTRWNFTLTVQPVDTHTLKMEYACAPNRSAYIQAFEGPVVLVGDSSSAERKREAIFPGLEWLSADEVSSSDLDIAADHPDRVRFVPHPHKVTIPAMGVKTPLATVGLLWSPHDQWAKGLRMPQPVFAVPDRLHGTAAHRLALIAPNVPAGLGENRLTAQKPFKLNAGDSLRLSALIYLNPQATDALSVVDAWFVHFRPDPPLNPPQGSDLDQIAWSMQAYTRSLWVSNEQGWLPFLGGPDIWRKPAFRMDFAYDLLKAARLIPEHPQREQWLALARYAMQRLGGAPARPDDMQLDYGDPENHLAYLRARAIELLQSQQPDGSWQFDADYRDLGVFKGMDYHRLGPLGAVELGTCARNAYEVLRYARVSGSEEAYRAGARALEFMRRFTIPRAAQVWEVPVHTPDILAAADAIDAYIEGYWCSGDPRWLAEARRWARAGLPFIYVWNAPDKPWMRYGSIPVFGATWFTWSWFGHIVQWNGLRYAYALLKLCEADPSIAPFWQEIALGITRSAMYQQALSGNNVALWPDSYHTITGERAAWDFAPRLILKNLYHFLGYDEEPRTLRLSAGVRVTSRAVQMEAQENGDRIRLRLRLPKGEHSSLLLCGLSHPDEVLLQGAPIPQVEQWLTEEGAQWKYSSAQRALMVRIDTDAPVLLEVRGVQRERVPDLPRVVTQLRFEFDKDTEGWEVANQLKPLQIHEGSLVLHSTGTDPFCVRSRCRFDGNTIRQIRLRIRVQGEGGVGEFYWTTLLSPRFDEDKVIRFSLPPEGGWREVVIPVGDHPLWAGHTITAIRLDPGSRPETVVEVDWMRGE